VSRNGATARLVEKRPAQKLQMRASALLIAESEPGDAIAELLSAQRWDVAKFERVEQLPDAWTGDAPGVVVLWARESGSLAGVVGPLAERFADAPLMVVCAELHRWAIRGALNAGAAGVALFEELGSTFVPCLEALLAGQICVPRAFGRQVDPPALSSREKQILGLVVMGYMNGQIAERLFLAESTVKSHLSSAFGKLGVRSRNEAVSMILDPDRGLGMGILALVGDSKEPTPSAAQ
jgi:DNA-binding NarL/FixJ family response regulator